jgi:hypothetical protein
MTLADLGRAGGAMSTSRGFMRASTRPSLVAAVTGHPLRKSHDGVAVGEGELPLRQAVCVKEVCPFEIGWRDAYLSPTR